MTNTISKELEDKIIQILTGGRIVTGKQLESFTGLTGRQLRTVIAKLREKYPICSTTTGGGGYWLADSREDIISFIMSVQSRVINHTETIDNMIKHL